MGCGFFYSSSRAPPLDGAKGAPRSCGRPRAVGRTPPTGEVWGCEPIQHTPWVTQGVATGIKYSKGCQHEVAVQRLFAATPNALLRRKEFG